MLKGQGPNAPGGVKSYVVEGRMISGFALIAYPAKYRDSGVMIFIVNQDGQVYQKDLGQQTESIASSMKDHNPDETWTPVQISGTTQTAGAD